MKPFRMSGRRPLAAAAVLGLLYVLAAPSPVTAAPIGTDAPGTAGHQPTYERKLIGKGTPDECFAGVGVAYPTGPPARPGSRR